MWKMMGPIMHSPFLAALPLCCRWLITADAAQDPFMYYFATYTSAITTVSLVLDAGTALQWASGTDPGVYRRGRPGPVPNEAIVLVPSLAIALIAYFSS
jgi:hypothetical protein